jgi:hypothetical protein
MARSLDVHLHAIHRLVLFLSVWLVYAGDRWLDAWHISNKPTPRHLFYREYRGWLFCAMAFVFPLNLWLAAQSLDAASLAAGFGLFLLLIAYFTANHLFHLQSRVPKELLVAFFFSFGTALFPVLLSHVIPLGFILASIMFAALCYINCRMIAHWEDRASRPDGIIWTLAITAVTILLFDRSREYGSLQGSIGLSAIGLKLLLDFESRLSLNARRVLVDAALLTPFFTFLIKP